MQKLDLTVVNDFCNSEIGLTSPSPVWQTPTQTLKTRSGSEADLAILKLFILDSMIYRDLVVLTRVNDVVLACGNTILTATGIEEPGLFVLNRSSVYGRTNDIRFSKMLSRYRRNAQELEEFIDPLFKE